MGHNKTNTTRLTGLTLEEERNVVRGSLERLREATGKKPVGWLGAGLAETWNTLDVLAEEGCQDVSDWVNDDQPYLMNVGGKRLVYLPIRTRSTTRPSFITAIARSTNSRT